MSAELPDVKIADGAIYLDGELVPAIVSERGVTVTPGGYGGVNELTVTFLVGKVDIADPITEADAR